MGKKKQTLQERKFFALKDALYSPIKRKSRGLVCITESPTVSHCINKWGEWEITVKYRLKK